MPQTHCVLPFGICHLHQNGAGLVKKNRRRTVATIDYVVRSTCGVWRICLSGDKIARIGLPPSPPSAGRIFKWLGFPERKGSARADGKGPAGSAKKGDVPYALDRLMTRIGRYFSGAREHPIVPFIFREGPRFNAMVWKCMRLIPFGETKTYGDLAHSIGSPGACRAVGNACAANPLPLLVPCHRVVGKRGLGGFSAGLEWKKFLLALEAKSGTLEL